ncbi:alpha-ketoacid dehydrogenase subunit beta [Nonomuraea dietziae]|uniref:Pyruvate dehydrogenase E1 component beta subunit n=1 Tax=Nonomuraea dietziae TaxID=65515 RepID=A0A7W5VD35_9ACTN|nr:transketolase C-terminal domain-containing protein [Nonomuraea dietziae]MBB3732626.1 pyruvate dehydrogenase E1 component beta subunit [Nonomuraea dietziae]
MRVAEQLNLALHELLKSDPSVHLLGEDLSDPYGGAFKITKGLSTAFGDRVRSTPLSESAIVGVGAGLALAGDKAIVEIMFADFVTLAFDQLVNFAAKSTTMYGRRVPMPLVVRCPSGGGRGYGPTHSQSPQKHLIGVPGLGVHELSPFHDPGVLLTHLLSTGEPSVLFEDKILYTRQAFENGVVDDLFRFELLGERPGWARVFLTEVGAPDCVLVTPGGMAHRALSAMRELLLNDEVACELLVPATLYPLALEEAVLERLSAAGHVCVADDGSEGGTWSAEVARRLYGPLWPTLRQPIGLVNAADSILPTALHLEREIMVQDSTIRSAVLGALS